MFANLVFCCHRLPIGGRRRSMSADDGHGRRDELVEGNVREWEEAFIGWI